MIIIKKITITIINDNNNNNNNSNNVKKFSIYLYIVKICYI